MMKNLFGTLLTMIVSLTVLLAVVIGIGFLLHWILPAIEIGIATLITIVACGILEAVWKLNEAQDDRSSNASSPTG